MIRRLGLALCGLLGACSGSQGPPLQPVTGFEVERYLGTWHEIAAIPASFQADCVAETKASYAQNDDGTLSVVNSCRTASGGLDVAEGRARFKGAREVAALEVSFVDVLGIQIWPFGGDYIIIALDEDYRWSLVGEPGRRYAWILAREPELPVETIRKLAGALQAAGYDPCRVLTSPRGAESERTPICEL